MRPPGRLRRTKITARPRRRALRRAASAFLVAMMLLTVADVLRRSLFAAPIHGTYELVELLLTCTFFLALPAVFLRDEHIVVDVVDSRPARGALAEADRARRRGGDARNHRLAVRLFAKNALDFGDVTSDLSLPLILYWIPLLVGDRRRGRARRDGGGASRKRTGERRRDRRPRDRRVARGDLRAHADRSRARDDRIPRLRGDRQLGERAHDGRQRAVRSRARLLAVGGAAVHPDGRGGLARGHVARALRRGQRDLLRVPRRARQRHDRRLRRCSAPSAAPRSPQRRPSPGSRSRRCAATATTRRSPAAPSPRRGRSASSSRRR